MKPLDLSTPPTPIVPGAPANSSTPGAAFSDPARAPGAPNAPGAPVWLLAGLASGQGKTGLTAGLAAAVRRAGHRVRVFKLGADFIDPMVLARATGEPVFNLDDRMVGLAESRARLAAAVQQVDLVLIEGAMGLYDGPPSPADLARALGLPVLVLVDAAAMAQTFGAVVQGLAGYGALMGQPVDVRGAIANRVASAGHARMLAESLPAGLPLIAAFPKVAAGIPERHLGLSSEAEAQIDAAIAALADTVAPEAVQALLAGPRWTSPVPPVPPVSPLPRWLAGRRVAVARDAAFRFLYPANLELLQALGAELLFFSPLADQPVPAAADALWLPGGYPELYGATLAQAQHWQHSVRAFAARGRPVWAECGGFMAVLDGLTDAQGQRWPGPGLLPGEARLQARVAGLGLQQWPGEDAGEEVGERAGEGAGGAGDALRGHSFHYATAELPGTPVARCLSWSGQPGEAVWQQGSVRGSFFHAYFSSAPWRTAQLFLTPEEARACAG